VASLARPGGNATGLTNFAADLIGKRLQFLKLAIPGLSRVALLVNPSTQVARLYTDVTQAAAAKLDLINHIPRFIDSPKNCLPWGDFGIRHGA
jgi:putative ABC transport system substrate-binding protein